jgi:hypothetical protein
MSLSMIDELMHLLQICLVACRDSAERGDTDRCRYEYDVLLGIRSSMDCDYPERKLDIALSEYRSRCEELRDEVLTWRYHQYESRIASIRTSSNKAALKEWRSERNSIVVKILDLGIANLMIAIANRDLNRAKIEADHIHNLPIHLIPGYGKKLDYYLEVEASYFLDLLERGYGVELRTEVASLFGIYWSLLESKECER